MSFKAPNLDDRKFQDFVDELKLRIPLYCPEWTDHNVSDPGVTLIELFAYMAEHLLYQMNQLPDLHYRKFAQFLGIPIPTPQPARAGVIFWLTKAQIGSDPDLLIPKGTEVSTTQTETIAPVIFTTEEEAKIVAPHLGAVLRDQRGSRPQALNLDSLRGNEEKVMLFSDTPQVNDAFYFEFDNDLSHHILRLQVRFNDKVGTNINVNNPPVTWEAYTDRHEWLPIEVLCNTTKGLNTSGKIELQLPRLAKFSRRWNDVPANINATDAQARYSIRVSVSRKEYDKSPELLQIEEIAALGRVVQTVHTQIVEREFLGESNGSPGQHFLLSRSPIVLPLQAGETLWVGPLAELDRDGQSTQPSDSSSLSNAKQAWQYVEHFAYHDEATTTPATINGTQQTVEQPRHFTIDVMTNEVRLAPAIRLPDGEIKQYGKVPARSEPLYFLRYRFAGAMANVPSRAINVLKSSIPYVARVENQHPAIGGQDSPSLEAMTIEVQRYLRHHQGRQSKKAVTTDDYVALVKAQFPEQVTKVECHGLSQEPNTLYIFVVAPLPIETLNTGNLTQANLNVPDLAIEKITQYLHNFRLLTVHIHVRNPTYVRINVRVRLAGKESNVMQTQIRNDLNQYLHPIYGSSTGLGWPLGTDIDGNLLQSWLTTRIAGIDIRQIQLQQEALTGAANSPAKPQWVDVINKLAWDQLLIPGRYQIEFE